VTLTGEPQSTHPARSGTIPPPRPLRQVTPRGADSFLMIVTRLVNRARVGENGAVNNKSLTPRRPQLFRFSRDRKAAAGNGHRYKTLYSN